VALLDIPEKIIELPSMSDPVFVVGEVGLVVEDWRFHAIGCPPLPTSRLLLLPAPLEIEPFPLARSESVGRRGWADMELPTLPVLPCRDRTCLWKD
jgi:hypothetical protein